MNLKHMISLTALLGALTTAGVASAGHDRYGDDRYDRGRDRGWTSAEDRLDVIGTARLAGRRGVATFTLTPGERRDGLQLATDVPGLRLQSVDLEYSDGRVERLRGPNLRAALIDAPVVTIQRGRPPGLRKVIVHYAGARDRLARLQLIQLHTGDGYTREEDIYRGHRKFDSHDIDRSYDRGDGADEPGYEYDRDRWRRR